MTHKHVVCLLSAVFTRYPRLRRHQSPKELITYLLIHEGVQFAIWLEDFWNLYQFLSVLACDVNQAAENYYKGRGEEEKQFRIYRQKVKAFAVNEMCDSGRQFLMAVDESIVAMLFAEHFPCAACEEALVRYRFEELMHRLLSNITAFMHRKLTDKDKPVGVTEFERVVRQLGHLVPSQERHVYFADCDEQHDHTSGGLGTQPQTQQPRIVNGVSCGTETYGLMSAEYKLYGTYSPRYRKEECFRWLVDLVDEIRTERYPISLRIARVLQAWPGQKFFGTK